MSVTKQKLKFNVMLFIPFLICVHSLTVSTLATGRGPEKTRSTWGVFRVHLV